MWLDETELLVGDSLIDRISQAIDEADYVVAILSPSSVRSSWVQQELRQAMTQEVENRFVKVLPVLISDCDLPEFLRGKVFDDFRKAEDYDEALKHLIGSVTSMREHASATRSMIRRAVGDWRENGILLEFPRLRILSESTYQPTRNELELIDASVVRALRQMPLAQLIDYQFELATETRLDDDWETLLKLGSLVKRLRSLTQDDEAFSQVRAFLKAYSSGDSFDYFTDWFFDKGESMGLLPEWISPLRRQPSDFGDQANDDAVELFARRHPLPILAAPRSRLGNHPWQRLPVGATTAETPAPRVMKLALSI